jgi:hypothetical protein
MNQTRVCRLVTCGLLLTAVHLSAQNARTGAKSMSLRVSTTSFTPGNTIPKKYTCDAQDLSPELSWSGAPASTKAYALIADDPDAPVGTWTHWLLWNIPASVHELQEGVSKNAQLPDGSRQGQNDFKKVGYNGPCPPPGKPHRYYFKLYALDSQLEVKPGATRSELETAIKQHTLEQAEVLGRYGR